MNADTLTDVQHLRHGINRRTDVAEHQRTQSSASNDPLRHEHDDKKMRQLFE